MAYDPTINTQFDGTKKLIYVFNIDNSKDGSTGTTVIDVSALAKSQRNQACNRISLNKIWFNISVTSPFDGAKLQWENSGGDETFLTLVGYDSWDFSNIGGIVNPNTGGNANGDVNIVIPAHTAGDTFSITTEWLKYYEA
jgi:hypothetical protein